MSIFRRRHFQWAGATMNTSLKHGMVAFALSLHCCLSAAAMPVVTPPAVQMRPLQDPWVPAAVRQKNLRLLEETSGATLNAQVEAKLKAEFDFADITRSGMLTRQHASNAGLGYIVKHFAAIDRNKTGWVRFADVQEFLRARAMASTATVPKP